MTKVSVIIPTTIKTEAYLRKCVESLRAAEVSKHWDIIVVSNGGPWYPLNDLQATRRLHITPQGQCIAVNYGAQGVSPDTDYIMVCNDDMVFLPDWGENLRFDHRVFSPNLIEPSDNAGSAPPFLKRDWGLTLDAFQEERAIDGVAALVSPAFETEEALGETTGFNLPFFCEVGVWRTIGGYDEAYDPWGSNSDTDLQTKFELAGLQPMRLRDLLVYHFGSKSGTFNPEQQGYWQRNWDYYREKFGYTRDDYPCDTWMALNMVDHSRLKFKPTWMGKYKDG